MTLTQLFSSIADAIRSKTGSTEGIAATDFPTEIESITTSEPNLQLKSVTITENTTTNISADTGYDGLSSVEVVTNVSGGGNNNALFNTVIDDITKNTLFKNLLTIPAMTFINMTSLESFFEGAAAIEEVPYFDSSGVLNMRNLFKSCQSITTIPLLDTSNVTNMDNMFTNCYNLQEIPQLNTSNVTNMQNMFYYTGITTIPLLDTSKVTNMNAMFRNCNKLISVPAIDTIKVTNTNSMFYSCSKLETVPVFNLSSATNLTNMFNCGSLLTDTSLNNILASCITATKSPTKTLYYLGLRSSRYEASRIQALSNYSAFTAAGWSIGY